MKSEVRMARRTDLASRIVHASLLAMVWPALALAQASAPLAPAVAPSVSGQGAGQAPAANAPASAPAEAGPDRVIGSVDGHPIYLSDLARVARTLPEQMRTLPFDTLMPVLLDRMIDHVALTMTAQRAGMDKIPEVQREMRAASDLVLEGAWLAQTASPRVTEAAIQARYNRQYLNRPATDEVRARHILVGTEAEAKTILTELKGGADFATVARVVSKDPDGKNGGDLGFFRRDQVWPEFADVAFSLQPGQVGQTPIHNEFGWHIVKVEEKRLVAAPILSEVHDQLRKELTAQAVRDAVAEARGQMIIRKFNLDGTELDTTALQQTGATPER